MNKDIYIIGYKGKSWTSKLIRWYTFGKYSHVEWLLDFEGLKGYGSFEPDGVKYYSAANHKKGTPYTIWKVEMTEDQKKIFKAFMFLQEGKPYDWKGILGFVKHKDTNNPDKWFCSEILTMAMKEAGIRFLNWEEVKPGLVSPNKFSISPKLIKVQEGKT